MLILIQLVLLLIAGAVVYTRSAMLLGKHLMRPFSTADWDSDVLITHVTRGPMRFFHMGVAVPGAIPFTVRRERFYHRSLKHLGIAAEIKVGDAGFDGRYFITTDFPGHLQQLLASKALQAHVNELFALPVNSLHTSPHRIWCAIKRRDRWKKPDYFAKHISILRQIAAESQVSLTREQSLPAAPWRSTAGVCVIAAHAGLLMFGFMSFLVFFSDPRYADLGALMLRGAALGAVLAAVWLWGIYALFKGTSWGAWVFTDFLIFGLAGFLLSGIFLARQVNTYMPQPQATLYEVPVLQKNCALRCNKSLQKRSTDSVYVFYTDAHCSPPQRQTIMAEKKTSDPLCQSEAWFTYRFIVKDWREPSRQTVNELGPFPWIPFSVQFGAANWRNRGLVNLFPSEQLFDAVRSGQPVAIPVHPGAMGVEWVDWDGVTAK